MLRVGIIDSGINSTVHSTHIAASHDFTDSGSIDDIHGHGSSVFSIIESAAREATAKTGGASNPSPANVYVQFFIAKIFSTQLTCTPNLVANAINWLGSKDVNLINMSFGLANDRAAIREACEVATGNNSVLIAAAPAHGNAVYPASYNGVVRATGDARCQPKQIAHLDSTQADFAGFVGDPRTGAAGASIGCAHVSAALLTALISTSDSPLNETRLTHSYATDLLKAHASFYGPERRQQ